MSCEQEWYAHFDGKANQIWADGGFKPNMPEVRELLEQRKEVEKKIEVMGGDPEVLTGDGADPSDGAADEVDPSDEVDDLEGSIDIGELLSSLLPAAPPEAAAPMVVDAISGAAALYNPDGSRVVVDQGEYEFEPPEWMVAVGEAILNGALRDTEDQAGFEAAQADGQFGGATFGGQAADSEGTTACPHTHTTDDDKVALCAN